MSSIPYIVSNISTLNKTVATINGAQSSTPASVIVPVASTILSAFTNDIFMDHNRLPTMQSYTFDSQTVNGHDLGDFVYICYNQYAQGTFQLVGDSGLFTLGFADLVVTPNIPDMTLQVVRPAKDFSTSTFTLKPYEQRSVFMTKGDYFRIFCTLPEDTDAHTLDGFSSNFAITRVSKNTNYTHPSPPVPL